MTSEGFSVHRDTASLTVRPVGHSATQIAVSGSGAVALTTREVDELRTYLATRGERDTALTGPPGLMRTEAVRRVLERPDLAPSVREHLERQLAAWDAAQDGS